MKKAIGIYCFFTLMYLRVRGAGEEIESEEDNNREKWEAIYQITLNKKCIYITIYYRRTSEHQEEL